MASNDINLLKRTAGGIAQLAFYEERLRAISWWALVALLVTGVIIGTSYVMVSQRVRSLEDEQSKLSQQISAASVKEGILLSLKQRLGVASKALAAARPWGKLFPLLDTIAPSSSFSTVSIDDLGRVNAVLELSTMEEAVAVVTNTLGLADQKLLRSAQLLSFSLRENGTVQLGLSFLPIL